MCVFYENEFYTFLYIEYIFILRIVGEGIPLYNHYNRVQLRTENALNLRKVGIKDNVHSHSV